MSSNTRKCGMYFRADRATTICYAGAMQRMPDASTTVRQGHFRCWNELRSLRRLQAPGPSNDCTMTRAQQKPLLLSYGAGIVLFVLAALSLHLPGSIWAGTLLRKNTIVALLLAATVLYFLAVSLVLRALPDRSILWLVLGVAFAMRAALLVSPPFMSSDIYRYVWDGRVQAAGINPYRYVPADPALAGLRDSAIYPNINRAAYAHTIYPPAAQAIFAAVGRVSQTVWATKLALLLLEAAGMAAMLGVLRIAGLPSARLLIYAWNPLAAWGVAGDGHIDGAAIGFLGLALLARVTRRHGLAGALLAGAILTKLLPLAVAPALWRRWGWRFPAACICINRGTLQPAIWVSAGKCLASYRPIPRKRTLRGAAGFGCWACLTDWARCRPAPALSMSAHVCLAWAPQPFGSRSGRMRRHAAMKRRSACAVMSQSLQPRP